MRLRLETILVMETAQNRCRDDPDVGGQMMTVPRRD
jgi:hypothetical protein